MTINKEVIFWLIMAVLTIAFIALLHEIMLPFVLGFAIAYFLDPIADKLEQLGLTRLGATSIITLVLGILFFIVIFTLAPLLFEQGINLFNNTPRYLDKISALINEYGKHFLGTGFEMPSIGSREAIRKITEQYQGSSAEILKSIWSGSMAFFSFLSLILITPVVAFYLLHDWKTMIGYIQSIMPREHDHTIATLAREIDSVISGFMRGQVSVCIILGLFYAISLSVLGLNSGFLIGVGAGLMSFIPFVGAIFGLLIAGGVAIAQFSPDWVQIGLVLLVFFIGQILEGNFLTPRIIGDHVRLHPVWLIFALFVSGYLFGFVGMLLAIPVAASIGVLARFAMDKYIESDIFQGRNHPCPDAKQPQNNLPDNPAPVQQQQQPAQTKIVIKQPDIPAEPILQPSQTKETNT